MPLFQPYRYGKNKENYTMTGLELDKLLNEALAKYGLSVKAVTESSHMPTTGVIMTPKGRRRVHIKDIPLKETNTSRDIQPEELKKATEQEEVN